MKRKKYSSLTGKKKGNVFVDLILAVVVFMAMGIVGVVGYNMFGDLNADIQADDDFNAQNKAISNDLYDRYPPTMDGGFLFMFILIWLFLLISSLFIDTHPTFFIISIILLLFGYGIIMLLGNSFEEVMLDDDFSNFSTDFPYTHFIMSNLLQITLAMGTSVVILLYGKNKFLG